MEKFKEIKKMGDGSFGTVTKAMNIQTNELVAIKKMKQKYNSWDECMNLRELKALKKLTHPNIIKLKEVIRLNDMLSFIFEFAEKNVYQAYTTYKDQGKYMPEAEIKSLMFQSTSALAYMHKHGFFHRDLKPENILVNNEGVLKIIDFGLAREIRSRPPYTDYVATRWYRAPEILLKQTNYNSPVDIFALGCIMCELYLNRPMFSGGSEMDQLNKILSVLGTFSQSDWSEGHRMISNMGMTLAQYPAISMNSIITNASPDAINLINQMLRWDPNKRITAVQMLQHPFFVGVQLPLALTQLGSKSPQKQQDIEEPFAMQQQTFQMQQNQQVKEKNISTASGPLLPNSKQKLRDHNINHQKQDSEEQFNNPSFSTSQNNKKDQFQEKLARNTSSEGRKRFESSNIDNFSKKVVHPHQDNRDIDEMLDFINNTTSSSRDPNQTTIRTRPPQAPLSLDPRSVGDNEHGHLFSSLNQQNVKSQVRLNKSIHDPANMQSINHERDNSIGNDYGGYMPSQMIKKQANSNIGNALTMPQQQQKTQNSIYNFDNVAYKPDQNSRQRQGGVGLQMPKQY